MASLVPKRCLTAALRANMPPTLVARRTFTRSCRIFPVRPSPGTATRITHGDPLLNKEGALRRRSFWRNSDGKLRKGRIALILLLIIGAVNAGSLYYNYKDRRIVLAFLCARTLVAIDRTVYDRTDFSSFEQTLVYFRWCVLVAKWACYNTSTRRMLSLSGKRHDPLTMDDFAPFLPDVDSTFDRLRKMPDGPARRIFHAKVRAMCEGVHRSTRDYSSYAEEDIERLSNSAPDELSSKKRRAMAKMGIKLVTLIGRTWWAVPKRNRERDGT
ncbi:hypothetical protein CYLTODRAFT_494868 [Cylindrobasidium torrendii FP15055 ss-10]|uniref:Uncharacterized protein n=1 Tax=Cylindrobasidium torrendii FP15055 ss-10 TaxID=1314674 RepID=A0A0D7AW79_9AGAR|nr:hypothetical protein CYLTODRAFT_494868 [Cylindrobasidium torrendii FP15055 ss-10]